MTNFCSERMNQTEKDRLSQINKVFYRLAEVDNYSVSSLSLDRHTLKTWFGKREFRLEQMYFRLFLFQLIVFWSFIFDCFTFSTSDDPSFEFAFKLLNNSGAARDSVAVYLCLLNAYDKDIHKETVYENMILVEQIIADTELFEPFIQSMIKDYLDRKLSGKFSILGFGLNMKSM